MKKRIRMFDLHRTETQKYILCKNVFNIFLKIEKKRFGTNKYDFIKFGVANKKGKAKLIALKINDFISERCSGYSNNIQYVFENYFETLFDCIHGNPDFYRFTPNSWTIGKFEAFVWNEEQEEGEPYFKKINKKNYNCNSTYFDQKDEFNAIDKDTGFILLDEDACELTELNSNEE